MGRWSREELEKAFHNYEEAVVEIGKTWDWASYADHFTEDAKYVEHGMGNRTGREEIREWISSTMNMFPGSEMPFFPCEWYAIDDEKGWVIARIPNTDEGSGRRQHPRVAGDHRPQVRGRWQVELRRGRLQPDELPGDGAGVRHALPQAGHASPTTRAHSPRT